MGGGSPHTEAPSAPAEPEVADPMPAAATPEVASPRAHVAPHTTAKSEVVDQPDGLRRETELVANARDALLHGQPANALAIVGQYHQEFPKGRLGNAAGLVEAQALLAAGQPQRAAERAKQLLATNKSGPFAEKLRSIIAQVEQPH
jgi:hypothetical protein